MRVFKFQTPLLAMFKLACLSLVVLVVAGSVKGVPHSSSLSATGYFQALSNGPGQAQLVLRTGHLRPLQEKAASFATVEAWRLQSDHQDLEPQNCGDGEVVWQGAVSPDQELRSNHRSQPGTYVYRVCFRTAQGLLVDDSLSAKFYL